MRYAYCYSKSTNGDRDRDRETKRGKKRKIGREAERDRIRKVNRESERIEFKPWSEKISISRVYVLPNQEDVECMWRIFICNRNPNIL